MSVTTIITVTTPNSSMQSRTALADTAGSVFSQECGELIEADQFDEVLDKLVKQFGLLFSKASSGNHRKAVMHPAPGTTSLLAPESSLTAA